MASPNTPPSSAELARRYSRARYTHVNVLRGTSRVEEGSISDQILARQAREQVAIKR